MAKNEVAAVGPRDFPCTVGGKPHRCGTCGETWPGITRLAADPLAVKCRQCNAGVGYQCRSLAAPYGFRSPHPRRIEDAAAPRPEAPLKEVP